MNTGRGKLDMRYGILLLGLCLESYLTLAEVAHRDPQVGAEDPDRLSLHIGLLLFP